MRRFTSHLDLFIILQISPGQTSVMKLHDRCEPFLYVVFLLTVPQSAEECDG